MAIGLLGIASGAVKVGQKIFQGIKNRKEKKIEKKAAALVEAQEKKGSSGRQDRGFVRFYGRQRRNPGTKRVG